MKRKLTEYQAWMKLAKAWDKPSPRSSGDWAVTINGQPHIALCICLIAWLTDESISEVVFDSMTDKIYQGHDGGFRWTLDSKGAKARAAFCRKMAAKVKPKRKVKA